MVREPLAHRRLQSVVNHRLAAVDVVPTGSAELRVGHFAGHPVASQRKLPLQREIPAVGSDIPGLHGERRAKCTLDAQHRLNRVGHVDGLVDYGEDGFSSGAVGDDDVAKGTVVIGELEPLGGRVGPIPDLAERDIRLSRYLANGRLCMGL